jgi:hypothetical protein
MTFLLRHKNILTFPQREEISVGVGQPSGFHKQEGIREGKEYV